MADAQFSHHFSFLYTIFFLWSWKKNIISDGKNKMRCLVLHRNEQKEIF